MKKTLIALVALSGLAMGEGQSVTLSTLPTEWSSSDFISSGSNTSPEGWVTLGWNKYTAENIQADFGKLTTLKEEGSHGFNHKGTQEASAGQIALDTNGNLVLTGRNGYAAVETVFVNITSVQTILDACGVGNVSDITDITFNLTGTPGTDADTWCWMYKLDKDGSVSSLFTDKEGSVSDIREKTSTALTFSAEQLASLTATDKIALLLRDGSAAKTYTVSSMGYTVSYAPEPATATLSLLALAGLASRRRRH